MTQQSPARLSSENEPITFLGDCKKGYVTADDIDDYVDLWHEDISGPEIPRPSLQAFLGFSEAEYSLWLTDASAVSAIVAAHLSPA